MDDKALFVEEEIGRIFCSEECISVYFTPEIERLEKEYFRRLSTDDLSGDEREQFAHLRWITLQEPDEVWREKTLSGDHRYTLISEFQPSSQRVWSICICLFLRGEPSFLYLAFTTRNPQMTAAYRRGERIEWTKSAHSKNNPPISRTQRVSEASEEANVRPGGDTEEARTEFMADRLADAWTEEETFLAQMAQEIEQGRRAEDIPPEEYNVYQTCLEETLESPNEVWSATLAGKDGTPHKLYRFIKRYPEFWYVIIAREVGDGPESAVELEEGQEQIEIVEAFPTRFEDRVDQLRQGEQEVGEDAEEGEAAPTNRLVH